MALSTQSLARASSRHPKRTILLWVLAVVVAIGFNATLGTSSTTTEMKFTNEPESVQASNLLEDLRGPERDTEVFIIENPAVTVDDPAFRSYVGNLVSKLRALGPEVVTSAVSFYETNEPSMVSQDRHVTIVPVTVAGPMQKAVDHFDELNTVVEDSAQAGFTTQFFGGAALSEDFNRVAEEDLKKGESIGILAALIILIVVFGAVVAATLPVIVGVAAITIAVGIVALVGQISQFSFFVTNMISMMGLAVGIDYSLFVTSRFREERHRGLDKLDAIEAAGATASRAVFFSGLTVVLALLGMLLVPSTVFRSLAAGAIFVVIVAVLASITLLPALLGALGDKINKLKVPFRNAQGEAGAPGGFWDRVTRTVMRRPVISLCAGVLVLLACAFSWTDMRTGFSGVSTLPDSFEAKQAFETLAANFPGGLSSPVEIVVKGDIQNPGVQAGVERLRADLAADPLFGPSQVQTSPTAADLMLISVPVNGDIQSRAATNAIGTIR
ncbi:MAG: MMPL family transporter, partial [Acidimicrobiales bacterium]